MSGEQFEFDTEKCKLVRKNLSRNSGTTFHYVSSEEYYMDGVEFEFEPSQSRLVSKTLSERSTRDLKTSELSYYDSGQEFDFEPASSRLIMKLQREELEKFMENSNSRETMVFDTLTGKIKVEQKSKVGARDADQIVMLDMNKQGPGGFFSDNLILTLEHNK